MTIYKEWKKSIENKIRNIDIEHIPSLVKRCPKCNSLSLEFDPKTGKIKCDKCGFEENIIVFKK